MLYQLYNPETGFNKSGLNAIVYSLTNKEGRKKTKTGIVFSAILFLT